MSARSYLDHNAASPIRPEVADAMLAALREGGNASSVHAEGRRARAMIEAARAQVAALVGAEPDRVIFTSGGTEANNLALRNVPMKSGRVLAGATEHVAILSGADEVDAVPVDHDGVVDRVALERALQGDETVGLLALQAANNETGVIQPVAEVATLASRHGVAVHCDAVQAAGRIPLAIAQLGVASLALSAHKLGGPAGVGALVLAAGTEPEGRLVAGGGQEKGRRGGTENLAGIVGFGVAAEAAARDRADEAERLGRLRNVAERLLTRVAPDLVILGRDALRLPNTLCFSVPGLAAETALIALDLAGVAVSSGAACSSGTVGRSHVLTAMGVARDLAHGALRVSFGWSSTDADVSRLIAAFGSLTERLYGVRTVRVAA